MYILVIQTLLLMAIAFILGAILGALLRTLFGSAETETTATGDAMGLAAVSMTSADVTSASAPVRVMEIPKPPKPPQPPKPTAPERPVEKAKVVAAPPAPLKPARKAKAANRVKVVRTITTKPKVVKAAAKPKAKPKPKASKTPDNLKLIRGIGPKNEGRLNALGVNQFAQIATWKKKDVQHFGEVLNFPGRIAREEWVKQAKVLAKGGSTKFSKRVKSGKVESSLGKTKAVDMGKEPTGLRTEPKSGKADKLTAIDGVGPAIEKKLNKIGIYHFDQISKMTKPQLTWLGNVVGFPGRPERENWAKEAKVLASGKPVKLVTPKRGAIKPKTGR